MLIKPIQWHLLWWFYNDRYWNTVMIWYSGCFHTHTHCPKNYLILPEPVTVTTVYMSCFRRHKYIFIVASALHPDRLGFYAQEPDYFNRMSSILNTVNSARMCRAGRQLPPTPPPPNRRLELALNKFTDLALPFHLHMIRQHRANIMQVGIQAVVDCRQ